MSERPDEFPPETSLSNPSAAGHESKSGCGELALSLFVSMLIAVVVGSAAGLVVFFGKRPKGSGDRVMGDFAALVNGVAAFVGGGCVTFPIVWYCGIGTDRVGASDR